MSAFFHSYRGKLVIYSISLMLFLSTITIYSYHYVLSLIQTEADEHISRVAQLSHTRIKDLRTSLLGYTETIRADLRLQEYMFIVTAIGSDKQPLQELYERHFSWLPIDRHMIISNQGQTLVGRQDEKFLEKVHHLIAQKTATTAYIESDDGLEIVAISPIAYRDSTLGVVIISKRLGTKWLQSHHHDTGIMALFEKQGKVISSCSTKLLTASFDDNKTSLLTNQDTYHTYRLNLSGVNPAMPQLWFAVQDTEITARLDQHRRTVLTLVSVGILAITLFGLLLIKNFSRPLSQLMRMTREVADGHLPNLEKTNAQNEIAALANQFSDMVKALREKQQEIEQVHAALEKSAITDMLTGLYNRRYLQVVFPKLIGQAQRDQSHVAAILIDIDKFKLINDTYGHVAGDLCLAHFSDTLKHHSRANDYLFRIGGEEFLILTIADDIEGIHNFAEKFRLSVATNPASHKNEPINFTISCGISFADPHSDETDILTHMLYRADLVLYQAKENGRNQIQIDHDSLKVLSTVSTKLQLV